MNDYIIGRSELAIMMLQWEEKKRALDELETTISQAVLHLGESVTVGNVKAKYSKGRNTYDYESPCRASDRFDAEVDHYTTEVPEEIIPASTKIDFRALAKHLGVDPLVAQPGTPSVKLEVMK